jgi:hypothetical protein
MKKLICVIVLLGVSGPALACLPAEPAPPGVQRRWASPAEARALVPFIAIGTVTYESDEAFKADGSRYRFTVERWVKGSGPDVLLVRGPYNTRKSKLMTHSCQTEIPVDVPIALLMTSVAADGDAAGIHEFSYLREANLFVRPIWKPAGIER